MIETEETCVFHFFGCVMVFHGLTDVEFCAKQAARFEIVLVASMKKKCDGLP